MTTITNYDQGSNRVLGSSMSAALSTRAVEIFKTTKTGIITLKIRPQSKDIVCSFFRKSALVNPSIVSNVLCHDDTRISGEFVKRLKLAKAPVAPGSVALRLPTGLVRDTAMDGRLVLETPYSGQEKGSDVGRIDYFSGEFTLDDSLVPQVTCSAACGFKFEKMNGESFDIKFKGGKWASVVLGTEDTVKDAIDMINMQIEGGEARLSTQGIYFVSKEAKTKIDIRKVSEDLQKKTGISKGTFKECIILVTYVHTTLMTAGSTRVKKISGKVADMLLVYAIANRKSTNVKVDM